MLFTLRVFNSLVPVLTSFLPAYIFLPFILNWCNIIAPLTLIHQFLSALFLHIQPTVMHMASLYILYTCTFLAYLGIYCTNVQYILLPFIQMKHAPGPNIVLCNFTNFFKNIIFDGRVHITKIMLLILLGSKRTLLYTRIFLKLSTTQY